MDNPQIHGYDRDLEILATLSRNPAPLRLLLADFGMTDRAEARFAFAAIESRFGVRLERLRRQVFGIQCNCVRVTDKSADKASELALGYWNNVYGEESSN